MWVRGVVVLAGALWLQQLVCLPVFAQGAQKDAPSPVAPGDLSKPVFDTRTPVYDSVAKLDKAASTVVAEVEGRPITMGDIGDAIRALPPAAENLSFDVVYPAVLEQLIKQEALVVHEQQQGADEDPTIRRRVRAAADKQLADEYMQWKIARDITEAELLARYDRDIAGKPGPEEIRVRVILTDTEKSAEDLMAEIRGGADFAAIARRASKDSTAPAGGDLGFKTLAELNTQVGAAAFTLRAGQISPYPVNARAGWFIVKVEERRARPTPSFPEAREQLRQSLIREKAGPLVVAAEKDLNIRRYSFNGAELDTAKPAAR